MKGLIYKDCMALWRTEKLFLLLLLVFSAVPTMASVGYGVAFAAMLPLTLIQIDENARWGRLSVMLPYSNLQLVLSKYLMGWGAALILTVVAVVAQTAGGAPLAEALSWAALYPAASTLVGGVLNPVAFRFGAQRGRLIFALVFAAFVAISVVLTGSFGESLMAFLGRRSVLPWIALPAIVLFNALSVFLSQKWFRLGARA